MNSAWPLKVRIGNAAAVTRVDVYDDIGDGGWSGGLSAQEFVSQVSGLKGELDIHVNSGGGDVFDGIAIASAIRDHKGKVTTTVDGIAASIASVIAQAGQERVMAPGAMLMIHDAFGVCQGDASEMSKMAQTLDKVSANIASIYADRAGGTADSWRTAMKTESWYTAEQAVAAGLADKVGGGTAQLPPGLDVAAFTAVPGQIAAALRSMPVAAVKPEDAAADGEVTCKTCGGSGRLRHAKTGKASMVCPGCKGSGTIPADTPEPQDAAGDCPTCDGTGKIMEGHRECPDCKGTGKKAAAAALTADDVLALVRHELQAAGSAHGDHQKWDPDNDGDCDACPEGDTDHDYWSASGKQLKDVPGKPLADDALAEQVRALVREELAQAGLIRPLDAIPDAVKSKFLSDLKNDTPVDIAAGMRRLSQWAASGSYPTGTTYEDLLWFYNQCAKELKSRDPDSEAGGNFPPKKASAHLETPLDAAGDPDIANCHALVTALKTIREAHGGDSKNTAGDGPANDANPDLSGLDLEEIGSALRGAFK